MLELRRVSHQAIAIAAAGLIICGAIAVDAWAQQGNFNSSRSNRTPQDGITIPGTGTDLNIDSKIDAKITITFPDGTVPDRKRFEQAIDFLLARTKGDLMVSFDAKHQPVRKPR